MERDLDLEKEMWIAPLYPHRTLWRYTNFVLLLLLLLSSTGWEGYNTKQGTELDGDKSSVICVPLGATVDEA